MTTDQLRQRFEAELSKHHISSGRVYRCRVTPRDHSPKGAPVLPWVKEQLAGQELILEAMWIGDDDDKYPGEWAMSLSFSEFERINQRYGQTLVWLASGDVEILEELGQEEFGL